MKVSLKWLRDYLDITIPAIELAEKLTIAGLEVGEVRVIGESWNNITVAKVIGINPHPNADRLRLATVDLGGPQSTVVCGAPNLNIGDKVAFASLGALLLDGHSGESAILKAAKIRGVLSEGMVCSEKELGISDSHEGILILPPHTPIGIPLSEYLGDTILEIDITPNRPDCLSIIGVGREIAALTRSRLRIAEVSYKDSGNPIDSSVSIEILDSESCPRYCASLLTDVKIGSSPQWLQQRLLACGMRPISNVVDVTNYVMLEYGQPLHAFDFKKVQGQQIIVRKAKGDEVITTLDGAERTLKSTMLVIADKERAVAIAGIMGGGDTEVTSSTATILIESANFNRAIIHKASIDLKLGSEASLRFEKGLSPELAMIALKRATQLMMELTGATVAKGIIDIYPGKRQPEPLILPVSEVKRLLGIDMEMREIVKSLELLGFSCSTVESSLQVNVDVPWWRSDITCKADLVEEIARVFGYEKIPVTMLGSPLPGHEILPIVSFRQRIRNNMISCGFQEILTYSLTSTDIMKKLSPQLSLIGPEPLNVANPMSKELECLRTTLRSGVLTTLARNQRFQQKGFRLFELGKVFLPQQGNLPREKEILCAVLSGLQDELFWRGAAEPLDFFITKGVAETILSRLGLNATFLPEKDESLRPGENASVIINNEKVGVIGEIHPRVVAAFDLSETAFMIELDIDKLLSLASDAYKYQPIPRYPSVTRDMALVMDEKITYEQIYDIIHTSSSLIKQVGLFDLYRGEQVPAGKKSLAFRIVYQSSSNTLSDKEVDEVQQNLRDRLVRELGTTLRA